MARSVVTGVSARRAARSGALWGLVFGLTIAATMSTYRTTFPTAASRANLVQTVQGNAAFEAVFGITGHMDTVAGYTAYKTLYTMLLIGAVWGLLTATRLLRGEEDAGRWELVLGGRATQRTATAEVAVGLGAGALALWLPTAVLAGAEGATTHVHIGVAASAFLALAVVAAPVMFLAVGMLASELAATRHQADLIGAAVLGASYLVRMIADSDRRIGWLRWASPLGWIEQLRPLIGSKPLALVPIAAFTAGAVAWSVVLAGRRDLGASVLRTRDTPRARVGLLNGPGGLGLRLEWPSIAGWLTALGATGLVFGLVTQAAGRSLRGSPTLARVIARLGATGAGSVTYLGFVFVVAAGLVACAAAGQISAVRGEEADGLVDALLVRPVARWRWLATRLALGVALVAVGGVLTGAAAWVGAATQHAAVGFGALFQAGCNVVAPAVFVLGAGALVFGVAPRWATAATWGLVAWSFLVEIVAAVTDANHWVRDTSPVLHITPAPAAPPDWTAAAWLVGLGLLGAVGGIVAFAHRDLAGA